MAVPNHSPQAPPNPHRLIRNKGCSGDFTFEQKMTRLVAKFTSPINKIDTWVSITFALNPTDFDPQLVRYMGTAWPNPHFAEVTAYWVSGVVQ